MACVDGPYATTLDVSTRYLSELVSPEYHDAVQTCHLSTLIASFGSQHSNGLTATTNIKSFLPPAIRSDTYLTVQPLIYDINRCETMPRSDNHLLVPRSTHFSLDVGPQIPNFQRSISIADLQAGKRMSSLECTRPELRRAPQSVMDLRTFAQTRSEGLRSEEYPKPFPRANVNVRNLNSHLQANDEYQEKKLRRKIQYKSYQDLHILSMYQENGSLLSLNSIRQPQSVEIESSSEAPSSPGSDHRPSPRPNAFPDKRTWREGPRAKESSASNEKTRRTNARQVHVIEQRKEINESENEAEIMEATVLIGPGKPKLIQIHRPKHSDHTGKQQLQHNYPNGGAPVTPNRSQNEKTSFSTDHTPASSGTRFSDISTVTSLQCSTPRDQHQPVLSIDASLRTHLLGISTSSPMPSTGSSSTIFSIEDFAAECLPDPFDSPSSQRPSNNSCNTSILDDSPPKSTRSTPFTSRVNKSTAVQSHSRITHHQHFVSAITSTNKALDALASNTFDLKSPILDSFRRNTGNDNHLTTMDVVLTTSLNRIFPKSPPSLRSTLAAWLIVDAYYTYLFCSKPMDFRSDIDSLNTDNSIYNSPLRLNTVQQPYFARSQASSPTTSLPSPQAHPSTRSRATISSPLYGANIPSKARSILGINTQSNSAERETSPFDNKSSSPAHIQEEAKVVHASVQTVGRKLVRDILFARTKQSHGRVASKLVGGNSKHGRARSGAVDEREKGGDGNDTAVEALWEACRCIASVR